MSQHIAIVGSGPAALMAADVISSQAMTRGPKKIEISVTIFEKRKSAGRKLLVAGSSGLNITNSAPLPEFIAAYLGQESAEERRRFWEPILMAFPPAAWIRFIENELGIGTFAGTSRRHFVEDMKAARLLSAWTARLRAQGVTFELDQECVGVSAGNPNREVTLQFKSGAGVESTRKFSAVCFALGGGSWEPSEKPLRWPEIFKAHDIGFTHFTSSNVGYQVSWPAAFLREAEGQPLKNIVMTSARGSRAGDAMITGYGIEGTPVYFTGVPGKVSIDLKPDWTVGKIAEKLSSVRENLSPLRRIKKVLGLCEASNALVFHLAPREVLAKPDWTKLAELLKSFPLTLGAAQPLEEAISSAGGVHLAELNETLMLRKRPGVFLAGEMLDWDAPTGGYLIQGAVSQGALAGRSALYWAFPGLF